MKKYKAKFKVTVSCEKYFVGENVEDVKDQLYDYQIDERDIYEDEFDKVISVEEVVKK